ncbi:FAD-dependent oxidoreductase [Alicyclobacillus ferrooxydans]|uniref:Nitrogen fixation protein FixC n=1 Tax=Alicyclobacillus ferrooxydans TaxID=471514 RepID=A0A0P9GNW9_9BACL|nr:FAD-dependent oxidoreductase [Alicyclobacillus ferrooxydans]KPV42243.1 nitrogen fixation protein FixC [Alicyclobacillus ferrooxydans]
MADERFDVVVVGAGPAGAAAALTAARGGLKVALIERGEYPGAKNTFGGVLYRKQIEQLIPEFWKSAPLERTVVEQRLWLLAKESAVTVSYRDDRFNDPPNCWTGQRSKFDQWFAAQAEAAGAVPIYETAVTDAIIEDGRVVGVVTDRDDGELRANLVIIADGVNSLLGKRLRAHREWKPDQVSLAVKEVIALPREKIQDRFNLDKSEGCTIELVGETMGMAGLGFLYTNTDTLSLGVGVMVSDLKRLRVKPYEVLNGLKQHPMIQRLIEGGEVKEYAGHLIPEGGYTAMPSLSGDGWMICGDAAQMVNAVHREGTNLAVESGRLAGETAVAVHEREDFSSAGLQRYTDAVRKSIIHKDLKKYKGLHGLLSFPESEKLFGQLPQAVNDALFEFLSVDGEPKRDKQKQAFRKLEGVAGGRMDLVRMALKGWRAMNG